MKIIKTIKLCSIIFLLGITQVIGQNFTSSNLPIVVINTDFDPFINGPSEILDDPRILANMKIVRRSDGSRNFLIDTDNATLLNYNGRINIEIRGSTSQDLPKKGYGLTTLRPDNVSNNNVSLLGMPSENDWILNPLAYDPSLIRDYLSYNLARQMGNYASRTFYCEVVINGEYKGLYILQERLKADGNRINIARITPTDNTLPNLSGGYITKADKTTGGDPVAWTMPSFSGFTTAFIHELPKPENVTTAQNDYIFNEFNKLLNTARNRNTSLLNGYTTVIDVPSFVDFIIMNEFAANVDGYEFSTFFHKDRGGKLRAGPVWDFNLTYGNDLFIYNLDRSKTDTWQFNDGNNQGARFWRDLFSDPSFKCYLSKRWNELISVGNPLNQIKVSTFIDNTVASIAEAVTRENQKWGTIPNHTNEIETIKTFIQNRNSWISNNIGSNANCINVAIPSLVINKINYNPQVSTDFPVSNDQEFIEIKNIGNTTVNLSGIYLSELGISYQFVHNSTIDANKSIFLASNPAVFESKYGIQAFDKFTRNLSNSSQKIILADAFGNVIDKVEYFDKTPWPTDADGLGSYLKLINTSLDNNIASSWEASNNVNLLAENPLPLEIANFKAKSNTDGNFLTWTILSSTNVKSISVLRKNQSGNFLNISTLLPANTLSFIDNNPLNGDNYYQLASTDFNGDYTIYPTIAIAKGMADVVSFYPNPVINGFLNISVDNRAIKSVSIYNLMGKKVFFKAVNTQNKVFTINDLLLPKGTYIIEIMGSQPLAVNKLVIE